MAKETHVRPSKQDTRTTTHHGYRTPMSPRKTILKELTQSQSGSSTTYTRPSSISGFSEAPDKYQKAVNELLQARLVEGRKDDEGHMAIAINEHRIEDVKRELRPMWARPSVWAVIAILGAVGAGFAI